MRNLEWEQARLHQARASSAHHCVVSGPLLRRDTGRMTSAAIAQSKSQAERW